MKDLTTLARVQEAERLIHNAIADIPLACSGPEAAAAVQALGLKMAEACMTPEAIAGNLIAQAEAYLKTPQAKAEAPTSDDLIARAHKIIGGAVEGLYGVGLNAAGVRELLLGYVIAWMSRADPRASAEMLYRHADALAGKSASTH